MFTFDTNVLIYFINGDKKVIERVDKIIYEKLIVYFSTISEAEAFSFKNLSKEDIEIIDGLLNSLYIIPPDSKIARTAGFLRRITNIKIADSIIAATALSTRSTLLTRNVKDFKKVPNLQIEEI